MKKLLVLTLAVLAAGLGGCAARPLTDSEFRGFCYTSIGRRASCDTIVLCDDFDNSVLQVKHASREDCGKACTEVYDRLYVPNEFDCCLPTVLMAFNWCKKYCNTNYPQ
jgi:hypothetical protein